MAENHLLPSRFLFRFAVPCWEQELAWTAKGLELDEKCRLPNLAELDGQRDFADVRLAWSQDGLGVVVRVDGKKQTPWCRESRIDESDGIQLFVDTRDTHNIHRASRFCHRFAFLPAGAGRDLAEPVADQLLVDRARENANPIRPGTLRVFARRHGGGYLLSALIPAAALTGYQPSDHPRLGFTYRLFDRELGEQTFSLGGEFPFESDPSVWGTLDLVRG